MELGLIVRLESVEGGLILGYLALKLGNTGFIGLGQRLDIGGILGIGGFKRRKVFGILLGKCREIGRILGIGRGQLGRLPLIRRPQGGKRRFIGRELGVQRGNRRRIFTLESGELRIGRPIHLGDRRIKAGKKRLDIAVEREILGIRDGQGGRQGGGLVAVGRHGRHDVIHPRLGLLVVRQIDHACPLGQPLDRDRVRHSVIGHRRALEGETLKFLLLACRQRKKHKEQEER